jgi:twitching motility protein PilT
MSNLQNYAFSNVYLGKDAAWLAGVPGKLDPVPAPDDCIGELEILRKACIEEHESTGKLDFTNRSIDIAFRVSVLTSLNEVVYVLRRFPKTIPKLEELKLHQKHIGLLMSENLTGLLLVAGSYSQGKTTTASSVVTSRISKYGGVAVTIEDPPEMPLEGRHGEGVCYQTWVTEGNFSQQFRQVARWAPSIIYVGEIRDAETAIEALRASITGRLVLATIHAENIVMAAERISTLSKSSGISPEDVSMLLSNGLRGILHQRLIDDADGNKIPKFSMLWLGDGDDDRGIRNIIKQGNFIGLENEIKLQLNKLLMGGK